MSRNSFLLSLLFSWTFSFTQVYDWQWARSATGNGADNGNCVTTDPNGNVFVSGYFYSPALVIGNHTLTNSGNYDVFIAKFDPAGNVLWARKAGGIYDDVALGISADNTGNVYLTGYFFSPVLAGGNFSLTNNGSSDLFIIKYDGSGNTSWAKNFGGNSDESGNGISCDPAGNLILTGYYQSTQLSAGNFTVQNSGAEDVFTLKADPAGNIMWLKGLEGNLNDRGNAIACDPSGNIFITGYFFSSKLVNGNDTIYSKGSNDAFTARYDSQGNFLWFRSAGGSFNDSGHGIGADGAGNITMIGTANSSVVTAGSHTLGNAGNFDLFIIQYSSSGNLLWARQEGGIFDDKGYGLATDASGNIFITGHSHSPSIIFGVDTLMSNGVGDIYVASYTSGGIYKWVKQAGGTADDGSSGLAVDAAGNVFVSGFFLSPLVSSSQFTVNNSGGEDLFIGKLAKPTTVSADAADENDPEILLYPNPTPDHVLLSTYKNVIEVQLLDQWAGHIKFYNKIPAEDLYIDLSFLPAGLYLLRIRGSQATCVKKLVRH